MVSTVLLAAPALFGVVCAAIVWCAGRLTRWTALRLIPSFIAAAGIGAGCTTAALHAAGFRIPGLESLYDAPRRAYRRAVYSKPLESEVASQPYAETNVRRTWP